MAYVFGQAEIAAAAPKFTPDFQLLYEGINASPEDEGDKPLPIAMMLDGCGDGVLPYPTDNLPSGICLDRERSCAKAKPGTWWNALTPSEKRSQWTSCRHDRRRRHDASLAAGAAQGIPFNQARVIAPEAMPRKRGVLQLSGVTACRASDARSNDACPMEHVWSQDALATVIAFATATSPTWLTPDLLLSWMHAETTPHALSRDPRLPTDKPIKAALDAAKRRLDDPALWIKARDWRGNAAAESPGRNVVETEGRLSAAAEYDRRRATARVSGDAARRTSLEVGIGRHEPAPDFASLGQAETPAARAKRDLIATSWLIDRGAQKADILSRRKERDPHRALPCRA